MRHSKFYLILFLTMLTVFSSCEKDQLEKSDNLKQFDILGQWKLEARTTNGISDLSILCCDYIMFNTDNEPDDLKGEFTVSGDGYETEGIFELKASNDVIEFDYDNSQMSYQFQISDKLMTFTYVENSQEIIENWRKEE